MATKKTTKSGTVHRTGFCNSGWHEGPAPLSKGGQPIPRCKGLFETQSGGIKQVFTCGCECHAAITEMYETAGIPRVWNETIWTSEEMRQRRELGLAYDPAIVQACIDASRKKSVLELTEEHREPAPKLPEILEKDEVKTLDGILPPNPFIEDPSRRDAGYRPRGQLNFDVKIACDGWHLGAHPHIDVLNCTQISLLIDPNMPPSTGAITNILRRWATYGFAEIGEGPLRFVAYTKAGIEFGYDELARNHKAGVSNTTTAARAAKAKAQADQLRTAIRPKARRKS